VIETEIDLFGFQLRANVDPVNLSIKFARFELSSPRNEPRSKRSSERGPAGRAKAVPGPFGKADPAVRT
jgi:hypothetical protein